jgi:sugar phosphate isomerase/epimerase
MPDKPESDFAPRLEAAKASVLPVRGCNGFIRPPHLKCTGPEANPEAVLEWAEIVFRRAQQAGVEYIVFGSAGARRLPEGWPAEKADEQFIELLRRMGPLAEQHHVTVAVEPLQERECNYLMRLADVIRVVRAANHSRIRAVADFYHMSSMEEGPEILAEAAPFLHCIEIAERDGRTPPGVAGQDFRPYFRALRQAGYSGPITIEGRWTPEQLSEGLIEIRWQAGVG